MILDELKKKIFDKNEKLAGKWIRELPYVVWSLRMQPSKALAGNTPFFMVYGSEAVLSADLQFGASRLVFNSIAEAEATRSRRLAYSRRSVSTLLFSRLVISRLYVVTMIDTRGLVPSQ